MDHFEYRDGRLHAEDVDVTSIAAACGTPTYVYAAATLRRHVGVLRDAFAALRPRICFSVKSCPNLSVLRLLAGEGCGMDVVSGGELHRALAAGIRAADCVYAGVGKTDAEMRAALEAGIGWFNVESEAELDALAATASALGHVPRAALRVNPDVDPRTHRYTTTGTRETKFGIDVERARATFGRWRDDPRVRLEGLHVHIGSPVRDPGAYARALEVVLGLADEVERAGGRIAMLDLGGGYAADDASGAAPEPAAYAEAVVPLLALRVERGLEVVLEPGRVIAANAGILLLRTTFVKPSGDRSFVILDGGMNAILRPSHYEAWHFCWPVVPADGAVPAARTRDVDDPSFVDCDLVGPLCETGDFVGLERRLPPMARGDLLAVFTAGAYGMSMANRYNASPLPAEVLVDGDRATIVRERETVEDLVAHERAPRPLALERDDGASASGPLAAALTEEIR